MVYSSNRWCRPRFLAVRVLALSLGIVVIERPTLADDPPAELTESQRSETLQERDQLWQQAVQLNEEGNLADAVSAAQQVAALTAALFGNQHSDVAFAQGWIADRLTRLERFGEAIVARTKQLDILTAIHGGEHWQVTDARIALATVRRMVEFSTDERRELASADTKNSLVMQLIGQGKYGEAIAPAAEALAIRRRILGEEHPGTAVSLNNLGFLHCSLRDYAAARHYYGQALAVRRKVLGEEHPDTALSLNNLGFLLCSQLDYAAARPYYEQALAIRRKALGDEHPDTALSLNNLAELLRSLGDYTAARPYYEQALAIYRKVLGEEHPNTTTLLNNLGGLHRSLGDYAAARPYYEQALAIRRKVLGDEHPDTAHSLNNLGGLLISVGDYASARPYYEEALAICRRVLGEEHPDTATSLNNLGFLFDSLGEYASARPYYEQALTIRRKVLGDEHPDTALALNNLGGLHLSLGDYAAARPNYEQALAIYRKVLGDEHPDTALSLSNLAVLLDTQGDYTVARPYYEQALAIRRKALGDEHPDTALSLSNLGFMLCSFGEYAAARPHLEEALAIRRKALGDEHPDTAASLSNLGVLFDSLGDYATAQPYYEQALAIYRTVVGNEHPDTAAALNNLGLLIKLQDDYTAARPYYDQSLAIHRKVYGDEHPRTATSLNNLGALLVSLGDYPAARDYYERALAIRRKVFGEEHPDTAASLSNLGFLLDSQGDYAAARPYYEQALAIYRNVLGEEHPDTALALNNLGFLFYSQGDYATARPYYEQALAIRRKVLGEEHPDTAGSLNNVGGLLIDSLGDYAAARPYFEQALAINRKVLGEEHLGYAISVKNLAILDVAQGNLSTAAENMNRALVIRHQKLGQIFAISTEARMRAFLATMARDLDIVLSLPLDELDCRDEGLTWLLRRKAIVFEALCRFRAAEWLATENPEVAEQRFELLATQRQLDDLIMRSPASLSTDALAAKRQQLQAQLGLLDERLKLALAEHMGKESDEESSLMATSESVRERLPEGAALIELVRFEPFNFMATGQQQRWAEPRYVAFVLDADPHRPVAMFDLGAAAEIEALVATLSERMQEPRRLAGSTAEAGLEAGYGEAARAVYERVFGPLTEALAGAKQVYLSLDGPLHNVPFEALVDEDDQYLVEAGYAFAYLTSGRDLLRGRDELGQGVYVFAGPDYDLGHAERYQLAQRLTEEGAAPQSAPAPETLLAQVDHASLVGTRSADVRMGWRLFPEFALEGRQAAETFGAAGLGDVHAYYGPEALEELVKRTKRPRVLVFVTHGEFLEDKYREASAFDDDELLRGGFGVSQGRERLLSAENPMLRSLLTLAGANQLGEPVPADVTDLEDGWLTAQEVAELDLRGTDLVVLSACETSRGQAENGDAVTGLRSAFLFAGARTIVGSLYAVPNQATMELMGPFYEGVAAGRGKLASLNAARLEYIERRREAGGAAHPFYWASFVLVGEP